MGGWRERAPASQPAGIHPSIPPGWQAAPADRPKGGEERAVRLCVCVCVCTQSTEVCVERVWDRKSKVGALKGGCGPIDTACLRLYHCRLPMLHILEWHSSVEGSSTSQSKCIMVIFIFLFQQPVAIGASSRLDTYLEACSSVLSASLEACKVRFCSQARHEFRSIRVVLKTKSTDQLSLTLVFVCAASASLQGFTCKSSSGHVPHDRGFGWGWERG